MQGATFTISSLGGIGGTAFTPIVNAPEVAILGVVRSKMAPVWDGKAFQPRLMLPLCLSYDHRVIDGAAAARFMRHLARRDRGHAARAAVRADFSQAPQGQTATGGLTKLSSDAERKAMASEIRLPDIGDFKDVPIIEIHIKPGQTVAKEEVMLTLESDKATLEVPAPEAGVIGEVKVKVGDKVSEGALLATYAEGGAAAAAGACAPSAPKPRPPRRPPRRRRSISNATCWCSARARAATPRRSAPPTSARKSCWSSDGRLWAASASTSAAYPPRRCCM